MRFAAQTIAQPGWLLPCRDAPIRKQMKGLGPLQARFALFGFARWWPPW